MEQKIKVYVVKKPGRKNLYLRFEPKEGKAKEKSSGTRIKRDAERAAARWEAELLSGDCKPKSSMSWDEFRRQFEDQYLPSNRIRTAERYTTVFNSIENIIKPKSVQSLTAEKILRWQNTLRKNGHPETTIHSSTAHLKVALRWAAEFGYLSKAPKITMPDICNNMLMRGGPITVKEFAEVLRAVRLVIKDKANARGMRMLLRGMFWGSLRLSEAIELHWSEGGFRVDLSGRFPMFAIKASSEKGKRNRLLPIAPEFASLLQSMKSRSGYVFETTTIRGKRPQVSNLSKIIADIGRASGVQTQTDPVAYATSHDLRRSFGTRWARLVKPLTLMQMMRHSSITTTQKYYISLDAEETAEILYAAVAGNKKGGLDT